MESILPILCTILYITTSLPVSKASRDVLLPDYYDKEIFLNRILHEPNEYRQKRPALSVSRDLESIAAIMRRMKADRAHSELVSLGKRVEESPQEDNSDIVNFLYKYHLNPLTKQTKKNRLSVDMQLSAISDMLDNQRMRNEQQQAHSALLKIGKRDSIRALILAHTADNNVSCSYYGCLE